MILDKNFFEKQKFSAGMVDKFKNSVARELEIAKTGHETEVLFHFAYMALLKIGIYYLAKEGYRVKSRPGHHQKVMEYLSHRMEDPQIWYIGEKMRRDRNRDLYGVDVVFSVSEVKEYLRFVDGLYKHL